MLIAQIKRVGWSFIFFCSVSMIVSTAFGKDFGWDLLNYHLYNPWALLHDRRGVDFFPAQLQTFFNPAIDLPFYWATTLFPDYVVVLLLGLPSGIASWVLWRCFVQTTEIESRPTGAGLRAGVALAFAVTGAAGLSQWGTTTGEWPVLALVMVAVYAILLMSKGEISCGKAMLIAGASLGGACGLKLTAAVPTLAVTAGMLFVLPRINARRLLLGLAVYVGAGVVCFCILAGPWMWSLQRDFGSPLFPFFNGIFHSPLLDPDGSLIDSRFVLKSIRDIWMMPIETAFIKGYSHAELAMRDPRVLVGMVISIYWLVQTIGSKFRWMERRVEGVDLFLSIVFVFFYVIWLLLFGIYRYAILLELLAVWMLYRLVEGVLVGGQKWKALGVAFLSYGTMALLTSPPGWTRAEASGKSYFDVQLPALPAEAMVLTMTDEPTSYLAALWSGSPPFASPVSNLSEPGTQNTLQRRIVGDLLSHLGPVFLLKGEREPAYASMFVLDQLQLREKPSSCTPIRRKELSSLSICATEPHAQMAGRGFDATPGVQSLRLHGSYRAEAGEDEVWTQRTALVSISKDALELGIPLNVQGWLPLDLYRKAHPDFSNAKLTIAVNGSVVAERWLDGDPRFSIFIPVEKVRAASEGFATVGVSVASSVALIPAENGLGPDMRVLSMRIRRVGFW